MYSSVHPSNEVGRAIVMASAGSKYKKQVIPKGWFVVKVKSVVPGNCGDPCRDSPGWYGKGNPESIEEAEGNTLLWEAEFLVAI